MNSTKQIERPSWIEVENDAAFEYKESGSQKTTLLIRRCTQLKNRVKRESDAIEFSGATRADCDKALAAFCERPDVRLMFPLPEESGAA